ncbi:MAG: caspase family protein, partial [Rhodoglobus sp.]|nr:caspase family protein [Rhodoglobus sp.]
IELNYKSFITEKPSLHVLLIAVDKYRDIDLRLKYSINDAEAMIKTIKSKSSALFEKVEAHTLYDAAVTKEGMSRAFEQIGKKTKREDVFLFFLAGHGITFQKDGSYYYLPVDFRYTGEEAIPKHGVSMDDFKQYLTHIQATKSLLLLDTCNSGSFAEAVASRGLIEKTAINKLTRAVGRATIVASSKSQVALEGYEGHGVFTYTVLEALSGNAADKEGKITINGIATYVEELLPKLTYKKWGYEQIPQKTLTGMDFPIAVKK